MLGRADPGGLPASERRGRVGVGGRGVPLQDAGLRRVGKRSRHGPGPAKSAATRPCRTPLASCERLLEAARALDDEQRAERLLLHDRALVRRTDDDRRRMPGARAPAAPPACGVTSRAPPASAPAPRGPRATRSRASSETSGPTSVAGSSGSPQRSAAVAASSRSQELVEERRVDDDAPVRRAALARRRRRRRGPRASPAAVEVRARPDDRGVVAAELRLERDPPPRADLLRRPARRRRAGERDRVDARRRSSRRRGRGDRRPPG